MPTHNTITIITSPTTISSPLPRTSFSSPITNKPPVQYRIEERSRTIYVTSDQPPGEWDQQSLAQVLKLADIPEAEQVDQADGQPIRRSKSFVETVYVVDRQASAGSISQDGHDGPPRLSTHHTRRSSKSMVGGQSPKKASPADTPKRASRYSPTRARILFYHKHDPYYGFTNFSAHPVVYKGKKYPTSEHLFQSFKVRLFQIDKSNHRLTMILVPETPSKPRRAPANLL